MLDDASNGVLKQSDNFKRHFLIGIHSERGIERSESLLHLYLSGTAVQIPPECQAYGA